MSRDPALRGGDIRPALEQIRGQAGRDDGAISVEGMEAERKRLGRLPEQDGDGMFELRATLLKRGQLRLGRRQGRLGLIHIELRADPALETAVGEVEVVLIVLDGAALHVDLRIGRPNGEIIGRDIGLQGEQDVFVVGHRGLGLVAGGLEGAAHLSPNIDLVAQIKRDDRGGVKGKRLPVAPRLGVELPVIRRSALPGTGAFKIERGEKIGFRLPRHGPRFADPGHRGAQGLAGSLGLGLQFV